MNDAEIARFIGTYLHRNSFDDLQGAALAQALVHHAAKALFAIGVVVTVVQGVRMIRQFNAWVAEEYVDAEDRQLHHVSWLLVLLVLTSIFSFAVNMVGRNVFVNSLWLLLLPSLCFSVLLFALCRVGAEQHYGYDDLMADLHAEETSGELGLSVGAEEVPDAAPEVSEESGKVSMKPQKMSEEPVERSYNKELADRLQMLVEGERLYLRSDLKVKELALRLGTNRQYLYELLNKGMGMSFSDYINSQRVQHARKLMAEHPDWAVLEIMQRSGFSSTSSFYRNMKRF